MKNKKWLKPLIVVVVILAIIAAAVFGIQSYLASRSVVLTAGDILATVQTLSSYLIVLGVIPVAAIVVSIAVFKLKTSLKGSDIAAIKADTEEVQKAFYAISEKLYQQQAPQGDPNMGGQQPGGDPNGGQQYYDADYKVVDDDDQNK